MDSQTQKTNFWLSNGQQVRGREINEEFGINIYILQYIKKIRNKDLLYGTGNYSRYLVITDNEK